MSNQTNNEKQHPEREASQQGFIELGDEQLEQVSGGGKFLARVTRGLTDINTLGLAEIFWQSGDGKDTYKKMKKGEAI